MGTMAEVAMAVEAETEKMDRKKGGMRTMPYIFGKQMFFIDSVSLSNRNLRLCLPLLMD
jgi:hypothetical protein